MSVVAPPLSYAVPQRRRRVPRWLLWLAPLLAIGLFFMVLVPSMCRSTESASRIKSQSNLRQIGLAMRTYADANLGVLPADWPTLGRTQDLTADVFVSPLGPVLAERAVGRTPAEWSAGLTADGPHPTCSYRLVAAGRRLADLKPDDVLAYEPVESAGGQGTVLLFADGTVDWMAAPEHTAQRQTYDRFVAAVAAGRTPHWPGAAG